MSNFYEILGVDKKASADEIKKAYKQAALKYHPDRNPGDKEAETRFKQATEAFETLSDENKRKMYDSGGSSGSPFDFSDFQTIFSTIFNQQQKRGKDFHVNETLSIKDIMTGCEKEIVSFTSVKCDKCAGTGSSDMQPRKTCDLCKGVGQIKSPRGFVMIMSTCPKCHGGGACAVSPCDKCRGIGIVDVCKTISVTFPAGIREGQTLHIKGRGRAGVNGAERGDLYVHVNRIEPDKKFQIALNDLITSMDMDVVEIFLGKSETIVLPNGEVVSVNVSPGTGLGVVTVDGKGLPGLDGRRGNLEVTLKIKVPSKISDKAKELLHELRRELT